MILRESRVRAIALALFLLVVSDAPGHTSSKYQIEEEKQQGKHSCPKWTLKYVQLGSKHYSNKIGPYTKQERYRECEEYPPLRRRHLRTPPKLHVSMYAKRCKQQERYNSLQQCKPKVMCCKFCKQPNSNLLGITTRCDHHLCNLSLLNKQASHQDARSYCNNEDQHIQPYIWL